MKWILIPLLFLEAANAQTCATAKASLEAATAQVKSFCVNASTPIPTPKASPTPAPTPSIAMTFERDKMLYTGPYFVQNNMWGTDGLAPGYSQGAGIGPLTSNGSVSARWKWNYPVMGNSEVKGYPAIGYGKKPGYKPTTGTKLPMKVDLVKSAITSWDVDGKYTGQSQLTYDLWLVKDIVADTVNFPSTPITHEIMLTVDQSGGYGLARPPAWAFGNTVIDGVSYKIHKADNFPYGSKQQWRFVVLQMTNPAVMKKGSVNFKNVFTYLKSVGLISGQEYLYSIEFGSENVIGTGDVYVRDFKAEVL